MTVQGWISRLRGAMTTPSFPPDFFFGVATADHQCEAYDAKVEDIRDVWERTHNKTMRGKATDFEKYFAKDIELARQLGCKAFRFSIAWSRVEPQSGQFSKAELDYYQRVIDAIRGAGMEPIVTLHHFTWPVHVEDHGGMIADDFPKLFATYTQQVVNRFGKDVRYWITFNEPSQLIYGYIKPFWEQDYFVPPGLPPDAAIDDQIDAIGKLIRNLFLAHSQAYAIIKAANPAAQVGSNPLLLGLPTWLQKLINDNVMGMQEEDLNKQVKRLAVQRRRAEGNWLGDLFDRLLAPFFRPYAILSTVVASNWWHLGMAGKLPEFLCPAECLGKQDFIGLDYYWGINTLHLNRIQALVESGLGHFDHAPVWAGALYGHLKYHADLFKHKPMPILIVENGSVEKADNVDRVTYLHSHLQQVQMALRDGINVAGYVCWSITSNREWGLPFDQASDFGLYHIDLDTDKTLERRPTLAAAAYKTIIDNRSA